MKKLTWVVFIALFCLAALSFGQATDANLVGTVLDATGAAIPNATLELTNTATAVKTTTTNTERARFRPRRWKKPTTGLNRNVSNNAIATGTKTDWPKDRHVITSTTAQKLAMATRIRSRLCPSPWRICDFAAFRVV